MPRKKMRKRHQRKSRRMPEQRFEYRIEKLLRKGGFLTLNCAMSRPFDIIAVKDNVGIPIELKARFNAWGGEQQEFQTELAENSATSFMVIQQLHKRNKNGFKIDILNCVIATDDDFYTDTTMEIVDALKLSVNSVKMLKL